MSSINASNAILMLSIATLFPVPQQIQGFAADDVFDVPRIKTVETLMGVDGVLSGGFVFVEIPWEVTLQADSASNVIFDTWFTQQVAGQTTYIAGGFIKLPGIATKFTLTTGFLSEYKPAPAGKRLLQPRKHMMTFGSIAPAPA